VLEHGYDIEDTDRFFSAAPQALPQGNGGGGGQQQPMGGEQPNLGVTSPLASAPTSPSNQTSVSPAQFQQRNMALNGGIANT
jgi:hypothetical protein